MNPFFALAILFLAILITQLYNALQKRQWVAASAVVTDAITAQNIHGFLELQIRFQFLDTAIHSSTVSLVEEFTHVSTTDDTVESWQTQRNAFPGNAVKLYYNPSNPVQVTLDNNLTPKDHSQCAVWLSVSMISCIIGFLV